MTATDLVDHHQRRQVIQGARRVVIKVGSRLLTEVRDSSKQFRIRQLITQCAKARKRNLEIILVTSGAISTGMELMGIKKRPRDLSRLQALAAIGQGRLMSLYEKACNEFGFHCAQILLSYDDLRSRKRHLNMCNCIHTLLAQNVLPIINENDTVSVDEISFGDNDKLAALVATLTHSELTIFLTNVDGLLSTPNGGQRERISTVTEINGDIQGLAKGTDGNPISVGGMVSKIEAAEICMAAGESLWIANGREFTVLERILNAEDVGTLFYPNTKRLVSSKRWLAFFTEPAGDISIDNGAVKALKFSGKSLLPIGIVGVHGEFDKGDTVNVVDATNKSVVAMGITNYTMEELNEIKGLKTNQICEKLGKQIYDEAIHRDNMVVFP